MVTKISKYHSDSWKLDDPITNFPMTRWRDLKKLLGAYRAPSLPLGIHE